MSVKIPKIPDNQSTVILTDHQTRGKGRQARAWSDKAYSSIIFSLIIKINPANIAVLADLCALKVCSGLNSIAGEEVFKIKYPNDIVFENKKICGILVKNFYDDKLVYEYTNIGVGINVYYGTEELKKLNRDYEAGSLDKTNINFVSRQDIFKKILNNMRNISRETNDFDETSQAGLVLNAKWKDLSSVYGREIKIVKHDKIVDGGEVVNIGIGRGIELKTAVGYKWFNLFESEMSVRFRA